jgi:hypothetical protein
MCSAFRFCTLFERRAVSNAKSAGGTFRKRKRRASIPLDAEALVEAAGIENLS